MSSYLITNGIIINEKTELKGSVLVREGRIDDIFVSSVPEGLLNQVTIIDAQGGFILPGVIDTHVHFREPGLTHKADLWHESHAAIAGGVTSVMEMPNTKPQTITLKALEEKNQLASEKCLTNYAFYLGATLTNLDEIKNANPKQVCGLKLFMGASTGQMLVDQKDTLEAIFKTSPLPIAVHCEDTPTIEKNLEYYKLKYESQIPARCHTEIRSRQACLMSTKLAVKLARKYKKQLHILHLSTADEVNFLQNREPYITLETCPQYLWFEQNDFDRLNHLIKCNPSIKTKADQMVLLNALRSGTIDTIATDHAPHENESKQGYYTEAASGMPGIQFSLPIMMDLFTNNQIPISLLVENMCHNPARIFNIDGRGFIRKGYFADITIINPALKTMVTSDLILSKCGWSPYEGCIFNSAITHTLVNGNLIFSDGKFVSENKGRALTFNR